MSYEQISIDFESRIASIRATQDAITLVRQPDENHYYECLSFARKFIVHVNEFTSEDLKAAYEKANLPMPKEPRLFGAIFNQLKKENLITPMGFVTAKNPVCHGRPIRKWQRVNN